jgi:hypothetical protein
MKNKTEKINSVLLMMIIVFTMVGCKDEYKELVKYSDPNYNLNLLISNNIKHADREYSFNSNRIVLDNVILKDCLSELLDKDTSLIIFESPKKGEIMLRGKLENLSQKRSEKETKKVFLKQLQKAMKFSLIEYYPENKFQLVVKDETLLNNYLTKNVKDTSSVYTSINTIKAYNSSLPVIADGLNKAYKDKAIFVSEIKNNNRYSINIENVPFENLKGYLENNLGLDFVSMDKIKDSEKITKVVFKD